MGVSEVIVLCIIRGHLMSGLHLDPLLDAIGYANTWVSLALIRTL